jgi:hypothetical protein
VLNSAPRQEDVLGEWGYSSTHSLTSALDGGEWSVSRPGRFTPGKELPVPIDRTLGGLQRQSGHGGEEKNSQPQPGIEPLSSDRPARSQSLYRLSYGFIFIRNEIVYSLNNSSGGLLSCDPLQCCGRVPTLQRFMLPPSKVLNYIVSHSYKHLVTFGSYPSVSHYPQRHSRHFDWYVCSLNDALSNA